MRHQHNFDDASKPCPCGAKAHQHHRPFLPNHEIEQLADLIKQTPIPGPNQGE